MSIWIDRNEGIESKKKTIFEIAENLGLVLTKLDTELGLAQPQLVLHDCYVSGKDEVCRQNIDPALQYF